MKRQGRGGSTPKSDVGPHAPGKFAPFRPSSSCRGSTRASRGKVARRWMRTRREIPGSSPGMTVWDRAGRVQKGGVDSKTRRRTPCTRKIRTLSPQFVMPGLDPGISGEGRTTVGAHPARDPRVKPGDDGLGQGRPGSKGGGRLRKRDVGPHAPGKFGPFRHARHARARPGHLGGRLHDGRCAPGARSPGRCPGMTVWDRTGRARKGGGRLENATSDPMHPENSHPFAAVRHARARPGHLGGRLHDGRCAPGARSPGQARA